MSTIAAKPARLSVYVSGYVLSLGLTIAAYLLVTHPSYSNHVIIGGIVALALVQFMVQLLCFLHIGTETKPRWKLLVLGFMVMVVSILVFGSIWIMDNLNYNMTPSQINTYLNNQDGI
jgi:cytochrome o ubiquinol oxidase operon protein cyoD